MKNCIYIIFIVLAGCSSGDPDRRKLEEIAKRNPLDMAGQDEQVIVLKKSDKKPQYPKVPTQDARSAPYIAAKNSRIYHARECEYANNMNSPVGFASWQDAEKSGHIPCEFCKPRER